MPLQKWPREHACSVFVDANLQPYPDQWVYLSSIQPMAGHDIEPTILRAAGGVHPLDVAFIDEEDLAKPWKRESLLTQKLAGPMPKSLTVTLANLIYFEKAQLRPGYCGGNKVFEWARLRALCDIRGERKGGLGSLALYYPPSMPAIPRHRARTASLSAPT